MTFTFIFFIKCILFCVFYKKKKTIIYYLNNLNLMLATYIIYSKNITIFKV